MPHEYHLRRITQLIAIIDHGSISAAARALGIAQSTVSTQLKQLENEVGAVLVDRSQRTTTLTEAGAVFLPYARKLQQIADEAADELARASCKPLTGSIHVGGTSTVTHRLLPAVMASFDRRYPEVAIELTVDNTFNTVARVRDGEIPLALVAADPEMVGGDSLHATQIGSEPQVVIISAEHPLANMQVTSNLLRDSRMLIREVGSRSRDIQMELLKQWRIPGVHTSTIASTDAIVSAVRQGLGFACVPRAAVADALEVGRVAEIFMNPSPVSRPVFVIHRHDRPLSRAEQVFLQHVECEIRI